MRASILVLEPHAITLVPGSSGCIVRRCWGPILHEAISFPSRPCRLLLPSCHPHASVTGAAWKEVHFVADTVELPMGDGRPALVGQGAWFGDAAPLAGLLKEAMPPAPSFPLVRQRRLPSAPVAQRRFLSLRADQRRGPEHDLLGAASGRPDACFTLGRCAPSRRGRSALRSCAAGHLRGLVDALRRPRSSVRAAPATLSENSKTAPPKRSSAARWDYARPRCAAQTRSSACPGASRR